MEAAFPTGPEITVEAVTATDFWEVSGPVSVDLFTCMRTAESANFKLVNVVVNTRQPHFNMNIMTRSLSMVAKKKRKCRLLLCMLKGAQGLHLHCLLKF